MKVDQHKHPGVILDPKLSFSAHIQAAMGKSRKAIGMLRFYPNIFPEIPWMNCISDMLGPTWITVTSFIIYRKKRTI